MGQPDFIYGIGVSIHVPTRGTTYQDVGLELGILCFNPRSHEGNDALQDRQERNTTVSIHVPTRGTTLKGLVPGEYMSVSIHVPTRGTTCNFIKFHIIHDMVSIHVPTRGTT